MCRYMCCTHLLGDPGSSSLCRARPRPRGADSAAGCRAVGPRRVILYCWATSMYIYMHICTCIHIHDAYIYIYPYIHPHHMHIYIYICIFYVHICIYIYIYMFSGAVPDNNGWVRSRKRLPEEACPCVELVLGLVELIRPLCRTEGCVGIYHAGRVQCNWVPCLV